MVSDDTEPRKRWSIDWSLNPSFSGIWSLTSQGIVTIGGNKVVLILLLVEYGL